MIRIAIVDDDVRDCLVYRDYLKKYEQEIKESIQVREFHDGDEIVQNYSTDLDLILMDIDMRFVNGMDAAKEIRQMDEKVIIIFMTNMPQYAMEGYKVDALDYVLKPINYYDFTQRLNRAISRMQKRQERHIVINVKSGVQRVAVSRIMYVEVMDHDLIYHTPEESIVTRGTMRDAEQDLEREGFFRCNKCYLVNLAYVDSVKGNDVQVGGQMITVSRSHRKDLLNALNDFMSEVAQ